MSSWPWCVTHWWRSRNEPCNLRCVPQAEQTKDSGWGFSSAYKEIFFCFEKWKKHNMLRCLNQNKFLCHLYKAKKIVGESDRFYFSGSGFSSENKIKIVVKSKKTQHAALSQ